MQFQQVLVIWVDEKAGSVKSTAQYAVSNFETHAADGYLAFPDNIQMPVTKDMHVLRIDEKTLAFVVAPVASLSFHQGTLSIKRETVPEPDEKGKHGKK